MHDIKLYLELDMDNRLRKALACISNYVRAKTEQEGIEELEKAIGYLQGIRKELDDLAKIREK